MEEDIKILESYLKGDKIYDTELDNAVKNLIARNKELEGIKNSKLDKYLHNNLWICKDLAENYIHKSKIKEKIEELDKEEKEAQDSISNEEREQYSDANIGYLLMDIETRRKVLQELLD